MFTPTWEVAISGVSGSLTTIDGKQHAMTKWSKPPMNMASVTVEWAEPVPAIGTTGAVFFGLGLPLDVGFRFPAGTVTETGVHFHGEVS